MGKKTKLPFLSKNNSGGVQEKSSSSWPWRRPSACHHQPRTLSFRTDNESCLSKTVINSAYLESIMEVETPAESRFSNSSGISSASFSTASDGDDDSGGDPVETVVIRGLRSERLFFKPGKTSSILEELEAKPESPFKESTVLSMESQHPFVDFRNSMEEMVEAHGLKHREELDELLTWYLTANGKSCHGYILGAFIFLLVKLAISSTCNPSCSNCSHSPSSPLSVYTSSSSEDTSTNTPCPSSLKAEEEIDNTYYLSSLSEAKKEIIKNKDDVSSSFS